MKARIDFTLAYYGADADEHVISFYDVAEALMGFERSLALTTHLVLNGEIITHAPALKGAAIYALPSEEGSWKMTGTILVGLGSAIMAINMAPKDTPIGNLIRSAYDYVIRETLGFHVDYNQTLGQQAEEYGRQHPAQPLNESKMDSLIEKCAPAIKMMHRPLYSSRSALRAEVTSGATYQSPDFDLNTYEYVEYTRIDDRPIMIEGRISSYNINTFKGRIFSFAEHRPISFRLAEEARDALSVGAVMQSMSANAVSRARGEGDVLCEVLVHYSRTDVVKAYTVLRIQAS